MSPHSVSAGTSRAKRVYLSGSSRIVVANIDPETVRKATSAFGKQILTYACNVPLDQAEELAGGNIQLSEQQAESFEGVVSVLNQLRTLAAATGIPPLLALSYVRQLFRSDQTNVFNALRIASGGSLDTVDESDPVLATLLEIGIEMFPFLLISADVPNEDWGARLAIGSSLIFGHPALARFEGVVLEDPALAQLFPTRGDDSITTTGYVMSNSGIGRGLQLALFADVFVTTSAQMMQIYGEIAPTTFQVGLREVLEVVRGLATGERVKVPAFIGFHNVSLDTPEVETPWGMLRELSPSYFSLLPSTARPSTLSPENRVLGFVLETAYPLEIRISSDFPGEERNLSQFLARSGGFDELSKAGEKVALALFLGVDKTPPAAATQAWTQILDPFSSGGISWNPRLRTVMPPSLLSASDSERVVTWSRRLEAVDDQSISICIRRILSALGGRDNAVDGFIDTVIAWENLFGSGRGEQRFRISAAMARLVAATDDERFTLQAEIAKLYDLRSRIIHGDVEMEAQVAAVNRDRALELSRHALAKLYTTAVSLLSDPHRSARILLTSEAF
jgi:hypothetical protein